MGGRALAAGGRRAPPSAGAGRGRRAPKPAMHAPRARGGVARARAGPRVAGGSGWGAGGEVRAADEAIAQGGGRLSGRGPRQLSGPGLRAGPHPNPGEERPRPMRPALPGLPRPALWYGPGLKGPSGRGLAQCVGGGGSSGGGSRGAGRWVRRWGRANGAGVGLGGASTWLAGGHREPAAVEGQVGGRHPPLSVRSQPARRLGAWAARGFCRP